MTVTRSLLCILLSAGTVLAQGTTRPDAFPTVPPAAPSAADPAPRALWTAIRDPEAARSPRLFLAGRLAVAVGTNLDRPSADSVALAEALRACFELGRTPEETQFLAGRRPFETFDASVRAAAITITIAPRPAGPPRSCRPDALVQLAMLEAGVGTADSVVPQTSPVSAVVAVDGRPVQPLLGARVPLEFLVTHRQSQPGLHQLRAYVPFDAVVPRADGSVPTVTVQVWYADGAPSEPFAFPEAAVRDLIGRQVGYRAFVAAPRTRVPVLEHPNPRNAELLEALARIEDGRGAPAVAALAADVELGAFRPVRDAQTARLLVAEWLVAAGDTAGARAATMLLQASTPCLRVSERSASPLATVHAPLQVPEGCATRTGLPRYAVDALLPGFGQLRAKGNVFQRIIGVAGAAVTVWQFSGAIAKRTESQDLYRQYQDAQSFSQAVSLYQAAADEREASNAQLLTATAVWGLVYAEHLLYQWARNRRIERQTNYGAIPSVRVGLQAAPNGAVGVALRIAL